MKLAIVNQIGSTGGWRYSELLIKGMILADPSLDITFYYDEQWVKATGMKAIQECIERLRSLNIRLSTKRRWREAAPSSFHSSQKFKNKCLNRLWNFLRKIKFHLKHHQATHDLRTNPKKDYFKTYDLVFYTWPYGISCPDTDTPFAFIPHDFIFSHFFGFHSANLYSQDSCHYYKQGLQSFMQKGYAVVGSHYIADELKSVFPEYSKSVEVIYHARFSDYPCPSAGEIENTLLKHGISQPYILYANNWAHHKNMGQVLGALYDVKQKHPHIKMVASGFRTGGIRAQCRSPYYCDHVAEQEDWDLLTLGLIPENEFAALMQGASMVINASLCEAGNGAGIDAWTLGVPVVMSEIPAFKDQMKYLGVRAELFDPRNSHDIARAINFILDNPSKATENARLSSEAMASYSLEKWARLYLDFFNKIIGENRG